MANVSDLREGLAINLSTITGLRNGGTGFIPTNVNPPYALIQPSTIGYHKTYGNGLAEYSFVVTVVVGQQSERSAQALLDEYCNSQGTKSIRKAVESDKTLNGSAYDVFVSQMRNYGSITIGEINYLAAEFDVVVQAD